MGVARILFLSDTHLGFDFPFRPRVPRRRRGPDFFANYQRALEPARRGEVDCVVHGGDVLFRSKVPARLVHLAFEPLKQLAAGGVPVLVVPGNHERSSIPRALLALHPGIHVFDRPQTHVLDIRGFSLAFAGFPFVRHHIRSLFPRILDETGWRHTRADGYVLCMHQAVDGARVGPSNYVFRYGDDVVRASDIPVGFAAVLSGHIHRFQVLRTGLGGHPLPAPVFYPGSIERTSFAEKDEKKGYLSLELEADGSQKCRLRGWQFHELPTRPMVRVRLQAGRMNTDIRVSLKDLFDRLPPEGVVTLTIHGRPDEALLEVLSAASLRALAPQSMNVSVRIVG